jgi:hypothetical protein
MAGLRSRLAAIAGVTAIVASALVIPLATPASAYVAANTTGCDFGMFPTAPGGQSGARFSCNFTAGNTRAVQLYHDFPTAIWHNGAAKTVSASTTNGSKTITAANGRFSNLADVNRTVSGPGIQPYTFITSVTNATTAVLSRNVLATGTGVSVKVENSNARSVNDGQTTTTNLANQNRNQVISAMANFNANDVGKSISGTNIPVGATITAVVNAFKVTMSADATATQVGGAVITIGASQIVTSTREINDGVVANSATATSTQKKTITSASAKFGPSDIGLPVTGTCIPAGSWIVSTNAFLGQIVLNQETTGCVTPFSARRIVIGDPTVTAPANGNGMATLSSALILNPTLVVGTPACSTNTVYGTSLSGSWYNPGSYLTAVRPAAATIGQIAFRTAVVNFAGYVIQVNANTAGDPQTAAHFDISFPSLPTGLAACPNTGTSSSVSFSGSTDSSSNVATGVGRPSTPLRGLGRPASAEVTSKAYYTAGVNGNSPAQQFEGTCAVKQVATFGFPCGN